MEAWTDERLDDLAAALRPLPAEVARMSERLDLLTDEMRLLRQDMSAMQRQLTQIGWGLAAALLVVLVTTIVTAV